MFLAVKIVAHTSSVNKGHCIQATRCIYLPQSSVQHREEQEPGGIEVGLHVDKQRTSCNVALQSLGRTDRPLYAGSPLNAGRSTS